MGELFTAPHLLFLGVIVLVLFGGKKLPELGKGLGEGLRGFKDGMKGGEDDSAATAAAEERRKEDEILARREARLAAERRTAPEHAGDSAHSVTPKPEEVTK